MPYCTHLSGLTCKPGPWDHLSSAQAPLLLLLFHTYSQHEAMGLCRPVLHASLGRFGCFACHSRYWVLDAAVAEPKSALVCCKSTTTLDAASNMLTCLAKVPMLCRLGAEVEMRINGLVVPLHKCGTQ